ncbi:MAG TPA: hypothetical protein VJ276_25385 [Thermoanaerobaculia bacterium]|nr:hypothetical protein [Thermoanaerobaculia bacterium]
MKKSVVVMLLPVVLALCACRERKSGEPGAPGTPNTQTIAPAQAEPTPTGTDAMTQTVDIEDSRSEEDGGVITSKQTAKTPGSTTTTATTTTTTTAPPKRKKP